MAFPSRRRRSARATIPRVLSALALAVTGLAVTQSPAAASELAGHCTLVVGQLGYAPALDLTPTQTTVTLNSVGTGCADVELSDASGQATLTASTVTITGTFTGLASTLMSQYSGTGTIRYDFTNGTHRIDTYTALCPAGAAVVCPLVGIIGPDADILELSPMPVNFNPLGPVNSLPFLEIACGRARGQLGGGTGGDPGGGPGSVLLG